MAEMSLKEAKRIAGRVGARIVEKSVGQDHFVYEVVLAGRSLKGVVENHFTGRTPRDAAKLAVLETGRQARVLYDYAKQVYVEEDIL